MDRDSNAAFVLQIWISAFWLHYWADYFHSCSLSLILSIKQAVRFLTFHCQSSVLPGSLHELNAK